MEIKNLGMPEFKIPETKTVSNGKFGSLISNYVKQVNSDKISSSLAAKDLSIGKTQNISETILAMQKAQVSLQLLTGIRNKLVAAYREVSRMQV